MGLAASPSVPFPTFSHQPNKQKLLGVLPKLQYCEVKDGWCSMPLSLMSTSSSLRSCHKPLSVLRSLKETEGLESSRRLLLVKVFDCLKLMIFSPIVLLLTSFFSLRDTHFIKLRTNNKKHFCKCIDLIPTLLDVITVQILALCQTS